MINLVSAYQELYTQQRTPPHASHSNLYFGRCGMTFTITELHEDGAHQWAIVSCVCNLDDAADPLVFSIVTAVREAYDEQAILASVQPDPDPSVKKLFDTDALLKGFRKGLPDPTVEGAKKPWLANYRSEATELLACHILEHIFCVKFPVHPQRWKTNQNQPVLGFDGWGFVDLPNGGDALVLVQVKGTDEDKRPPQEANKLAEECRRVPRQSSALCRALSILGHSLKDPHYRMTVIKMLEGLGNDIVPTMVVAPVVVRGTVAAHVDDLVPIRTACHETPSIVGRGVIVSLGTDLGAFGHKVMTQARTFP